jgi:hypothetical protein
MGKNLMICAAIGYLMVMIITFGWAASDSAYCLKDHSRDECVIGQAYTGLMAAMVWPLYWTWDISDHIRGKAQ